ncbi:NADP-dependent phosphogluconate dehydrogenase [Ginsengibacter hankyongi]|uniref:6-phosphogluconate dehydrogenase, decarboxylating n=1 Tax=Ginsengibacter hankyongi TaxID=2607284 RepID=A0A5J5ILD2_9BACT|nr:NADP-dependent phosphogluconate dehydrogenase [Ginsengibacter hankyongi]KAA9041925.1 NADP-dependent phosphogluconate dehydrogenase [Ginsengibacter hankyongi]
MSEIKYDFGMIGLGVMGSNLLLNMADHGFAVIGYDKNPDKTNLFESSASKNTVVKGVNTLQEMIDDLKVPRKIMMLVPAGKPVDSVIADLSPLLQQGDIIIDGGNSHYVDTLKRITALKDKGFHFMGIGISGGEEGARKGPSIMPGGDLEPYKEVEPLLKAVAAKVNGVPCVGYLGKDAAGHYVKMVHNGIEYSIMELISECYDLMHNGVSLSNNELHEVFDSWDRGELKSFLLEITGAIFEKKDEKTGNKYLVDMILDKAGAKGTGQWTSQEGLDLPMPIPSIDSAVMMRNLSSLIDERKEAATLYKTSLQKIEMPKDEFITLLKDAFYFATIISYSQGLAMLTKASHQLNMEIPLPEVVSVWRGGCIIRSALLENFKIAYENAELKNLLLDNNIAAILKQKEEAAQKIVSLAALHNYPVAGFMSSLNYYNAYRRNLLPTNLIQAQRDFFGAHTYQRIDEDGIFHTEWETKPETVSTKNLD